MLVVALAPIGLYGPWDQCPGPIAGGHPDVSGGRWQGYIRESTKADICALFRIRSAVIEYPWFGAVRLYSECQPIAVRKAVFLGPWLCLLDFCVGDRISCSRGI